MLCTPLMLSGYLCFWHCISVEILQLDASFATAVQCRYFIITQTMHYCRCCLAHRALASCAAGVASSDCSMPATVARSFFRGSLFDFCSSLLLDFACFCTPPVLGLRQRIHQKSLHRFVCSRKSSRTCCQRFFDLSQRNKTLQLGRTNAGNHTYACMYYVCTISNHHGQRASAAFGTVFPTARGAGAARFVVVCLHLEASPEKQAGT